MKFLADQDVYAATVRLLRKFGHDAEWREFHEELRRVDLVYYV